MAAAVAPLPVNNQLDNVLPPSALAQNSARHGRSRGMSFKGKGAQGRRYSVVEDSDKELAKALMFVLKRTIKEDEVDEDDEVDNVVAGSDGWVGVDDIVSPPLPPPLPVPSPQTEASLTPSRSSTPRFRRSSPA